MMMTQQTLREMFVYDPEDGTFRWRVKSTNRSGPKKRPGDLATCVNGHGYNTLYISGEKFLASRLAWLYMTGEWPKDQIDHTNMDRGDDRWGNLREATRAENCANRRLASNNTSGHRGVSFQQGMWLARITVRGSIHTLGLFSSKEEAIAAREEAAVRLHGEFAVLDSLSPSNLPI